MRSPGVGEAQRYRIRPGQVGINRDLIPRMIVAVQEDHANPEIRTLALDILADSGCREHQELCYAKALYEWVAMPPHAARFHWIDDPVLEETLYWPRRFFKTIQRKGKVLADCASVSSALVALMASVGMKPVFVFAGDGKWDGREPVVYHVFVGLLHKGKMFYFEPTEHLEAGTGRRFAHIEIVDPWKTGA